jgi:hypothetical protein
MDVRVAEIRRCSAETTVFNYSNDVTRRVCIPDVLCAYPPLQWDEANGGQLRIFRPLGDKGRSAHSPLFSSVAGRIMSSVLPIIAGR